MGKDSPTNSDIFDLEEGRNLLQTGINNNYEGPFVRNGEKDPNPGRRAVRSYSLIHVHRFEMCWQIMK